jgi:hypothetical protein
MAKHLIQAIVLGSQIVFRSLQKAVQKELQRKLSFFLVDKI